MMHGVQYAIVHGEKVLRQRIANLRLAISDENLELLPDYEQRVDVLKELNHIDEYSTVLLKGRVACEVRFIRSSFVGIIKSTLRMVD
jgi:antiviral helicase SKI2